MLICASMVCGCLARHKPVADTGAVTFVDAKIRDAAESISKDMSVLTGSSWNRDATSHGGSGDLYTKMDMTWDGPLDGALRKVASTAGFKLIVEGEPPIDPVLVHVKLKDRPCLAVLREIGLQTGPREGIMVNEGSRTITLKYSGGNA